MWFMKKRKTRNKEQEAEIEAIKARTQQKIDAHRHEAKKLEQLLEEDGYGVTSLMYAATHSPGGRKQ